MGTVPIRICDNPLGGDVNPGQTRFRHEAPAPLTWRGKTLMWVFAAVMTGGAYLAYAGDAIATPQHPPAIFGGQCEQAYAEATVIAEKSGAYALREMSEDGILGNVIGKPMQVTDSGQFVRLRGPLIELGASTILVLTVTGYDDSSTPEILASQAIHRPSAEACRSLGRNIDVTQKNDILFYNP